MVVFWGVAGAIAGLVGGLLLANSEAKPCEFCGYHDDETKELFEAEELNKMLEDNE